MLDGYTATGMTSHDFGRIATLTSSAKWTRLTSKHGKSSVGTLIRGVSDELTVANGNIGAVMLKLLPNAAGLARHRTCNCTWEMGAVIAFEHGFPTASKVPGDSAVLIDYRIPDTGMAAI